MEILLPVVGPVLLGGGRNVDLGTADPHTHVLKVEKSPSDLPQDLILIELGIILGNFLIKRHLGCVIIETEIRNHIAKIASVLIRRNGGFIFNLDVHDAEVIQHGADKIFGFLCRINGIFHPFHIYTSTGLCLKAQITAARRFCAGAERTEYVSRMFTAFHPWPQRTF